MHEGTIFDLSSLTKPLATTTAIMLLVRDGKMRLDDRVTRFFHNFGVHGKTHVTFRHLLAHSSGLPAWRPFYKEILQIEREGPRSTSSAAHGAKEYVYQAIQRERPRRRRERGRLQRPRLHAARRAGRDGRRHARSTASARSASSARSACARRRSSTSSVLRTRAPRAGHRDDRADRALPVAQARAVRRGARRQRLRHGRRRRPRRPVRVAARRRHARCARCASAWLGEDDFLPPAIVREFWTRDGPIAGSTWALGWDTPSPAGLDRRDRLSPHAVGHLGFTGTSIWIDLERDRHVILLTNRVHPSRDNEAHPGVPPADPRPRRPRWRRPGCRRSPRAHLIAIAASAWRAGRHAASSGLRGDRLRRERLPADEHVARAPRHPGLGGLSARRTSPAPDLVVVGNKVSRGNAEVQACWRRGLPYAARCRRRWRSSSSRAPSLVVVAGTHGKTTSTAMLAWVLEQAGGDPSLMVGGAQPRFRRQLSSSAPGRGFVDRGRRVRHRLLRQGAEVPPLPPDALLLTAVEFDHADIYRDLEHVKSAFRDAARRAAADGAAGRGSADFPHARRRRRASGRPAVVPSATAPGATWRADRTCATTAPRRASTIVAPDGRRRSAHACAARARSTRATRSASPSLARALGLRRSDGVAAALPSFRGVRAPPGGGRRVPRHHGHRRLRASSDRGRR